MKPRIFEYYDFYEDIEPELLKNLNALLAEEGTDPITDLSSGYFKDGHWVNPSDGGEYRNFWHVWLEFFGEDIRNDSYVCTYFPLEVYDYVYERADEQYGLWATTLIKAVEQMSTEHGFGSITIWYSW